MTFTVGTRLGPYEILGPLGAGGMGDVYRARDTRLGREVAIKTVNAPYSERFEREARAISALNHPQRVHALRPGFVPGHRVPRHGTDRRAAAPRPIAVEGGGPTRGGWVRRTRRRAPQAHRAPGPQARQRAAHRSASAMLAEILDSGPLTLALPPSVPAEAARIVGKLPTKSPSERYQHADEVATDLRALVRAAPQAAPSTPVAQPVRARQPRWWWTTAGVVALAALAVAGEQW